MLILINQSDDNDEEGRSDQILTMMQQSACFGYLMTAQSLLLDNRQEKSLYKNYSYKNYCPPDWSVSAPSRGFLYAPFVLHATLLIPSPRILIYLRPRFPITQRFKT
jgi:hypothetical protein